MTRVRKTLICSLGAFGVLAALWGCNGTNIDDPTKSDSVLVIDSVEPASVQADVSPSTDPITMLMVPPADDTVTVKVRNVNRTQGSSGVFGDILLNTFDVACSKGSLNSSNNPSSLTIQAESSADISVLVAAGPFKEANSGLLLAFGTDLCEITFNGVDLSGDAIISKKAVFGVSFVNTP